MNNIKQNLALINQKIDSLKSPTKVVLVAVSKQQNASKIIEAVECGQTIFGENYLQEALKKQQILQKYKLEWHFIGPIQSNKCKSIAENFSWVHTIDRLKIASRINDARKNMGAINICIQINISNEETKSGVRLGDAKEFINEISKLDNLTIRGLMAIPSNTNNEKLLAKEFQLLGNIYEEFKKIYPTIDTLSMGMSNDYLNAINHGANMVRIGSNIFGARA
jgi:hypothetical protein